MVAETRTSDKAYRTPEGRHAGEKRGDVLSKVVKENGVYNNPPGIAWAAPVLDQAQKDGCTRMHVYRSKTGDRYTCTFETFRTFALERNHPGFGRQYVLPFRYWQINGNPSEKEVDDQRRAVDDQKKRDANSQLGLFGGEL